MSPLSQLRQFSWWSTWTQHHYQHFKSGSGPDKTLCVTVPQLVQMVCQKIVWRRNSSHLLCEVQSRQYRMVASCGEWLAGRQQILNELHCGHLGLARMKSIAQMYVWWPKMDETVFLNSRVWLGRLPKEMTCSLLNWNNYTSNVSMPIQASSSGNEKEKEWYDYKYPCKWSIRYK